jgi:hypothetical protein
MIAGLTLGIISMSIVFGIALAAASAVSYAATFWPF